MPAMSSPEVSMFFPRCCALPGEKLHGDSSGPRVQRVPVHARQDLSAWRHPAVWRRPVTRGVGVPRATSLGPTWGPGKTQDLAVFEM